MKRKIKPDALYRCVEPLSFVDEEGVPRALGRGTVLLGRHPYIARYRHVFALEGDPEDQARARAALTDHEAEKERRRASDLRGGVKVMETKARAIRAVVVDVDGTKQSARKGDLIDPSELVVTLVPDARSKRTNDERAGHPTGPEGRSEPGESSREGADANRFGLLRASP